MWNILIPFWIQAYAIVYAIRKFISRIFGTSTQSHSSYAQSEYNISYTEPVKLYWGGYWDAEPESVGDDLDDLDARINAVDPNRSIYEGSDNLYGAINFAQKSDADQDRINEEDDEDPYVYHNGDEVMTAIGGGIVVQINFDNETVRVFLGDTGLYCWFNYDEINIV